MSLIPTGAIPSLTIYSSDDEKEIDFVMEDKKSYDVSEEHPDDSPKEIIKRYHYQESYKHSSSNSVPDENIYDPFSILEPDFLQLSSDDEQTEVIKDDVIIRNPVEKKTQYTTLIEPTTLKFGAEQFESYLMPDIELPTVVAKSDSVNVIPLPQILTCAPLSIEVCDEKAPKDSDVSSIQVCDEKAPPPPSVSNSSTLFKEAEEKAAELTDEKANEVFNDSNSNTSINISHREINEECDEFVNYSNIAKMIAVASKRLERNDPSCKINELTYKPFGKKSLPFTSSSFIRKNRVSDRILSPFTLINPVKEKMKKLNAIPSLSVLGEEENIDPNKSNGGEDESKQDLVTVEVEVNKKDGMEQEQGKKEGGEQPLKAKNKTALCEIIDTEKQMSHLLLHRKQAIESEIETRQDKALEEVCPPQTEKPVKKDKKGPVDQSEVKKKKRQAHNEDVKNETSKSRVKKRSHEGEHEHHHHSSADSKKFLLVRRHDKSLKDAYWPKSIMKETKSKPHIFFSSGIEKAEEWAAIPHHRNKKVEEKETGAKEVERGEKVKRREQTRDGCTESKRKRECDAHNRKREKEVQNSEASSKPKKTHASRSFEKGERPGNSAIKEEKNLEFTGKDKKVMEKKRVSGKSVINHNDENLPPKNIREKEEAKSFPEGKQVGSLENKGFNSSQHLIYNRNLLQVPIIENLPNTQIPSPLPLENKKEALLLTAEGCKESDVSLSFPAQAFSLYEPCDFLEPTCSDEISAREEENVAEVMPEEKCDHIRKDIIKDSELKEEEKNESTSLFLSSSSSSKIDDQGDEILEKTEKIETMACDENIFPKLNGSDGLCEKESENVVTNVEAKSNTDIRSCIGESIIAPNCSPETSSEHQKFILQLQNILQGKHKNEESNSVIDAENPDLNSCKEGVTGNGGAESSTSKKDLHFLLETINNLISLSVSNAPLLSRLSKLLCEKEHDSQVPQPSKCDQIFSSTIIQPNANVNNKNSNRDLMEKGSQDFCPKVRVDNSENTEEGNLSSDKKFVGVSENANPCQIPQPNASASSQDFSEESNGDNKTDAREKSAENLIQDITSLIFSHSRNKQKTSSVMSVESGADQNLNSPLVTSTTSNEKGSKKGSKASSKIKSSLKYFQNNFNSFDKTLDERRQSSSSAPLPTCVSKKKLKVAFIDPSKQQQQQHSRQEDVENMKSYSSSPSPPPPPPNPQQAAPVIIIPQEQLNFYYANGLAASSAASSSHCQVPALNPHHPYIQQISLISQIVSSFLACLFSVFSQFHFLHKFRSIWHQVAAFPLALIVCSEFWILHTINSDWVLPKSIQPFFPAFLNHGFHTYPIVFVLLDSYTCCMRYPRSSVWRLVLLFLLIASYLTCFLWIKFATGKWLYPVFDDFSSFGVALLILASFCGSILSYFTGKCLNNLFWTKNVKKEKQKKRKTIKKEKKKKIKAL